MGNQIICCRQKWSQLNDSDEKLCVAEFRPSAGYTNAAAVFNPEVWQCSSTSRLYNYDDVSFSLGSADQAINLKHWTTQHISEREPEDAEFDPSLNASQHALFISGMQGVHFASPRGLTSRRSQRNKVPSATPDFSQPSKLEERETLKRWSSCSTVYIGDGCLVHPDRNTTLWSVAVAVGLLIRSKRNYDLSSLVCSDEGNPKSGSISLCGETAQIYRDVYSVFDERTYPIGCYKSSSSDGRSNRLDFVNLPQFSEVHRFILGLFRTALLGPECAIVALSRSGRKTSPCKLTEPS
ncbi:unnamed protein product [Calicophoron daubneyi]|uniref:Uncharacterized protein n=1 Tax=Calicophoron daubneyi TaxID=300641 RepID=A0AAV2TCY8_CALDB